MEDGDEFLLLPGYLQGPYMTIKAVPSWLKWKVCLANIIIVGLQWHFQGHHDSPCHCCYSSFHVYCSAAVESAIPIANVEHWIASTGSDRLVMQT